MSPKHINYEFMMPIISSSGSFQRENQEMIMDIGTFKEYFEGGGGGGVNRGKQRHM